MRSDMKKARKQMRTKGTSRPKGTAEGAIRLDTTWAYIGKQQKWSLDYI
jgi:hypothetical protein